MQGFWVLHISQPGRLGALMNVQEGQDQPGCGGGEIVAAYPFLLVPRESRAQGTQSLTYLKGAGEAGGGWQRSSGLPQ